MLHSLISTIAQLIAFVLLIRVHINYYAFLRTPLESTIVKFTDVLVFPLKNVFPKKRIEVAPLAVAYIIYFLITVLSGVAFWKVIILAALLLAEAWLYLILIAVVISVLASWLQTPPTQPFLRIVNFCHSWLSAPIRQRIPNFQTLDFSPIVVLLVVDIAMLLVRNVLIPFVLQL